MDDDLASEDRVRPLLVVTAATPSKPPGFKKLVLCIRFVISLKRITAPPPINQPSTTGTSSSGSFIAIDVADEEGERDEIREIEKRRLKRIVKEKNLPALVAFGGVQAAVSVLHSEPQPQIAAAIEGLELSVCGLGSFFLFSREFWYSLWQSLNSCTILILIIAVDLSLAIGSLEQGLEHGWHDAVGILVAVFVLVFFPSAVSFHRRRAEEKELLKIKNKLEVTVERGGICVMVSVSDVKVGEIVHLKKGDHVPADGLLISGKNLILDEVINPKADPERNPFLFFGSVVECGEGIMVSVSTGADTAVRSSQETLLQSRINKPYEFIEKFSLSVSSTILVVILTRLICEKLDDYHNDKPETKGKVTMGHLGNAFERMLLKSGRGSSFLATVLLTMVMAIQHGMPFAIIVSLCLWREKIRSHGGKSQNLSTCGTLGLVSAICIDITGEPSFHEVEVGELLIGKEKINPGIGFHPDILEGFEHAAKVLRFDHIVLSSENGTRELMSRSRDPEANLHLHYNGDASTILNMCSEYYDIRGTIHDIRNQKDFFKKVINDMRNEGLKPIAFACKQTNDQAFEEGGLKLLGFVGLKYSCQKIKTAFEDLRDVGVRIILTSEDEISVATAIAIDLGIHYGSNNQVFEGEKFREIVKSPGMAKNDLMKSITVMGKATPEDKHILLQELKAVGHVVALLGGLTTSDAVTLMEADVGVTLQNRSTEVSRTASDLICEDATSLSLILKCGRCAYLNIQKFYQVQLTASISGPLITLVYTMVSGKSPITTIHLIWVTLIMCLLGSLMMVMELNGEEVKCPLEGDRNRSLITKVILKKVVIHILCQALLFLLSEYVGKKIPLPCMDEDVRHTMIFNTFILCQICNLLGAMGLATGGVVVFKAVLKSLWFLISLVGVLVVQVMVIEFAGTIVNGVKLSAVGWAVCFLFASLTLTLEWAQRISVPVLATFFSITRTFFMFVVSISYRISVILSITQVVRLVYF